MNEDVRFLEEQVDGHHAWFARSLPMIASENVISPLAREMLLSDFGDRYAEGLPGERYYQGNVFVDEVEVRVADLAKRLFRCRHADVRPISGTVANLAVLFALLKPGDILTTVALSHGAHISTAKFGAVGVRGVNAIPYPFDVDRMNIDVDEAAKLIVQVKPKVALFGQSVFLFPSPLRELEDAFQEARCRVWYDGAHVMGLIAGGQFQDPLREGADVMTGSTHKTLPGPQHGIMLSDAEDEKFLKRLQRAVFPGVVSNHHLHAMAALGITLAEHLEFGAAYATQVVRNAKALGQALHERGFRVLAANHGFTESHALAVDVKAQGGGAEVALALEKANVITNKNLLPWDTSPVRPSGIRLGTQELTRLGMREHEMAEVADFLRRVVLEGEAPESVGKEVAAFRADFPSVQYCFEAGTPAHDRMRILRGTAHKNP
jgi:glycine hydroxymethyltransferase